MAQGDHLYNCYAPPAQEFVRGEGVYLYTESGDKYLDFIAGIAVTCLGHSHPGIVETIKGQAENLLHLSNMFRVQDQYRLAEKYCDGTFADKVFFTNSGAEALECAIKTARKYQHDNGNPERVDILSFSGAFHGRTNATINAGGNPKYLKGFGPALPGYINLPFGDHKALELAVNDKTAAILVEPVQGEGGLRPLPTQCLVGLRELCDKHGLVLIYDEVQCGAGRTGKLWAHQWAEGKGDPDIMAVAKGVGGGFPFGACLAREEIAAGMVPGTHGSTYGGGPLAMAVGNTVYDELTSKGFMEHVVQVSNAFKQGLEGLKDRHPEVVIDVRGKGLLIGMQLKKPAPQVKNLARENGLLIGNAGNNVLRMAPPLVISEADVSEAVRILDITLTDAKALDDFEG